jgi:hypothetical protein
VHSVLLYGAPSWADTLDYVPKNVKILNQAQRKVLLRRICAYRTVSEVATNILSSTPLADIIARNREMAFVRRRIQPDVVVTTSAIANVPPRNKIMIWSWKNRIETAETEAWTKTRVAFGVLRPSPRAKVYEISLFTHARGHPYSVGFTRLLYGHRLMRCR